MEDFNIKHKKMKHLEIAKLAMDTVDNQIDGKPISNFIHIQGNKLHVSIQNGTVIKEGVNGIQVTDLLKFVKEIYISLNNDFPCIENEDTISSIQYAIDRQNDRTRDRIKRGVEGRDEL